MWDGSETITIPIPSPFYPDCACMCACGYIFSRFLTQLLVKFLFFLLVFKGQKDTETVCTCNKKKIRKVTLTIMSFDAPRDSVKQVESSIATIRLGAASHRPVPLPTLFLPHSLLPLSSHSGARRVHTARADSGSATRCFSSRLDEEPQGGTLREEGNKIYFCHMKV